MADTETEDLITIGAMARASGLTASALRFYDDGGLLVPARVDALTGYRYYAPAQCERAILIRRLREIGIPLDAVAEILSGDPGAAGRLLDEHVDTLARRAERAALVAAAIKRVIGATVVTLSGQALAEAIDQVVDAAARDHAIPVLAGVLFEVGAHAVTLTATDRYRLSTRTLVPEEPGTREWRAVLDARELAELRDRLWRVPAVDLIHHNGAITLRGNGFEANPAPIEADYPDYRAMLAALAPVLTRVVLDRSALLDALEGADDPVRCAAEPAALHVHVDGSTRGLRIPASGSGPRIDLAFTPATLRPAVAAALGPDIMLDIAGADQPVVVRSATDGDLTTLVMPRAVAPKSVSSHIEEIP